MSKRLQYSSENLHKAVEAAKRGMPILRASKTFGVPRSTIQNKLKGKTPMDKKSGPSKILSKKEEEHLVKRILYMGKIGFPVTRIQLIDNVRHLLETLERKSCFTNGKKWCELFLKRHPEISQRVAQNLTTRRSAISEDQIRQWFSKLTSFIEKKELQHVFKSPSRIFNCDETAFYLSPQEKSVLVRKGFNQVYNRIGNDEKECLTTLRTVNAEGTLAPPIVLYSYERLPANIVSKYPKEWGIGKSDSGWMTCETFFEYITNVFFPWAVKTKIEFPIALFLDGHCSHLSLPLIEFCRDKKLILIALVPNATHLLQPLDVAVCHPIKNEWKNTVKK